MAGRGKKLSYAKNDQAARDFAAGKKLGRPKQVFIPQEEPTIETVLGLYRGGSWKKVGK